MKPMTMKKEEQQEECEQDLSLACSLSPDRCRSRITMSNQKKKITGRKSMRRGGVILRRLHRRTWRRLGNLHSSATFMGSNTVLLFIYLLLFHGNCMTCLWPPCVPFSKIWQCRSRAVTETTVLLLILLLYRIKTYHDVYLYIDQYRSSI